MKLIGGAILGVTALAIAGSASAADLPSRKSAPVAYVKICDVYGRGFYYIPGTNTCLKVGGRVRFELGWHQAQNAWIQSADSQNPLAGAIVTTQPLGRVSNAFNVGGPTGGNRHLFRSGAAMDTVGWKARAYVNMDARTQTAWGTVQTVFSIAFRSRSGIWNAGTTNYSVGGQNTASLQTYRAFIRFAGFTVGRAGWLFASAPGTRFYSSVYSGGSSTGMMQFSYTAVFGGGFSATAALVDKDDFGRQAAISSFTNVYIDPVAGIVFGNAAMGNPAALAAPVYPNRLPNALLSLRLDQGWGHVQLSAAIGRNHAVYGNGNGFVAPPTRTLNKTGWAIGAEMRIKLPMLARGDDLNLYVAYADGLIDMIHSHTVNGSTSKDRRLMGGYRPFHNNLNAYVCGSVAQVITAMCSQNTKAFVAMAMFTHYWTPQLRSNFGASYMKVTPGSAARNVDWFLFGGQPVSTGWQAIANLVWSPTSGFDIGLEVNYQSTQNKLACGDGGTGLLGGFCTPWGSILAPSTIGVKQTPSDWQVRMRLQRTF
ncbi:MAG: porin [Beijerinckiaceae bacterium]